MDIGVGGFALWRKGLSETTAIKMREYLHAGLPVIVGYTETGLSGRCPFVLTIDLRSSPALADVRGFVADVRERPEWSEEAHAFARKYLLVDRYVGSVIACGGMNG
jgi:hypothetical protein